MRFHSERCRSSAQHGFRCEPSFRLVRNGIDASGSNASSSRIDRSPLLSDHGLRILEKARDIDELAPLSEMQIKAEIAKRLKAKSFQQIRPFGRAVLPD